MTDSVPVWRGTCREVATITIDESIGPARFRKVKLLFRVMSALPVDERAEILGELCPEDEAVRRLVLRLLAEPGPAPADEPSGS